MKVATGLSKVSGVFRCHPWRYLHEIKPDEYFHPTIEDAARAVQNYEPIKAKKELMKERRERY